MRDGKGVHVKYRARHVPAARQQGQRLPDRPRGAEAPADTYSGVGGIAMQDASLQESMGPIVDRTKENLVSTDNGIIMARHRLMRAAKALAEKGTVPPGVDAAHQQRALGRGDPCARRSIRESGQRQACRVTPGVAHASV